MATIMAVPTTTHSSPHAGEILRELYLAPMHVMVIAVAKALDVTRGPASGIVNGHVRITADMAIRLTAALETEAQL
jgi:antitoxin HigA-1